MILNEFSEETLHSLINNKSIIPFLFNIYLHPVHSKY